MLPKGVWDEVQLFIDIPSTPSYTSSSKKRYYYHTNMWMAGNTDSKTLFHKLQRFTKMSYRVILGRIGYIQINDGYGRQTDKKQDDVGSSGKEYEA